MVNGATPTKNNNRITDNKWFVFLTIVSVGHILTGINGGPVTGAALEDGRSAKDVIENAENYPLTLKFTRPKMTTNEKIFLASMFYPLFAIASQLSPEPKSSGIEVLEADTFKLHCFQTLTGKILFCFFVHANCDAIELMTFFNNDISRCQIYGRCGKRSNWH